MNEQSTKPSDGLEIQLIDLYGQLLLDSNLIFAIILAWAATHIIKNSPWVRNVKPKAQRDWTIRLVSIATGIAAVVFMKRHLIDTHLDHVITFAVMVGFTHPFLYKLMTLILGKVAPNAAEALKVK